MTDEPKSEDDTDNNKDKKPPGPTDQGREGGMATREVAPDLAEKRSPEE